MKKDEMIALLQQQISFLQQQLREANRKADALLKEVASLRNLLERKSEEEVKQKRVIKGLAKISQNKSEKQPSAPASQEAVPGQPSEKKERAHTNNGAKRKQHLEVEVVEENVDPEDPRFNKDLARLYKTRDVIRYELIPMRFIKKVYHVRTYTQNDEYFSGKAPDAPFLNSQYDGSFIAGIAQLRYLYSMPVERIVNYFSENGFNLDKQTAHGLLKKTAFLFENLHRAMRSAVKEDNYICADETYHKVLVNADENAGKGIRKGYVWVILAAHLGLTYFFYDNGSRSEEVILNELGDYSGTIQSDGLKAYKKVEAMSEGKVKRLACLQHCKRDFLDMKGNPDADRILELCNDIYGNERKHKIGENGWTAEDNLKWRQEYAPPILEDLKAALLKVQAQTDKYPPKSQMQGAANYFLNEWDGIEAIPTAGDYAWDNNQIERINRYVSLSRKNSLFFGSHAGAERGCVFYSLACSCRLHRINFFEYLSDILNRMSEMPNGTPVEAFRNLLPDKWTKKEQSK